MTADRLRTALADIDRANTGDPSRIVLDAAERPVALVEGQCAPLEAAVDVLIRFVELVVEA